MDLAISIMDRPLDNNADALYESHKLKLACFFICRILACSGSSNIFTRKLHFLITLYLVLEIMILC